ncbi:MAG: DUF4861 family protein [Kiritimatiellia bacterium]
MKKRLFPNPVLFLLPCAVAAVAALGGECACGVAEKRENDFFWENDKFGMRAYGPGEFHKWSGLDVFNKMADAEGSVKELLAAPSARGNWHKTPWKGILDNYTIGASRGCGAVALWGDGEWKTYPDWETCEIVTNTPDRVEFRLTYPAFSCLGRMTYHITLARGARFFRNTVTFEKDWRTGFALGPGLDLEPARGHTGVVWEDTALGVVALFEDPKNADEGSTATAILLDPADAAGVELKTDHLNCRVLALGKSTFTYYAGAAWSKAGEITTAEQWRDCIMNFRKELTK